MLDDKVVLITGGTGSFGRKFTEYVFARHRVKKLIILSRDEFKQHEMSQMFPQDKYRIRFFLGDVRDRDRLYRAFNGVDYVIHAAALKHVMAAEYNPFEVAKTNIIGAQNIVEAAIDNGVKKVVALSTDKAVNPINLYGATKLAMEKILVAANSYVGTKDTAFSVVRYGNVVGSRGSVIPLFLKLIRQGAKELPLTDERMTRFWITLDEAVEVVENALVESIGGEVFVPKMPSMKVVDLIKAICEDCRVKIVGARPGEKIHETLVSTDESAYTIDFSNGSRQLFVVLPTLFCATKIAQKYKAFKKMPEDYPYRSDGNDLWLTVDQMKEYLRGFGNSYEMNHE
ncbi:MAG: UDP-N-acetylglucosamine 4,6-dehydratase (inverting) [Nitrospirae bacterium]|nr:UDP-N-acetylglucosamine 4,6-dehydratase (inverting) [Nitrospirota bacterium]